MQEQIFFSEYMQQSKVVRDALRIIFALPRTGKTETVTDATGKGVCVNDGTTNPDLSVLTFDKMLTYLGEASPEDNIHSLFTKTITKIEANPTGHQRVELPKEVAPVEVVNLESKPEEVVEEKVEEKKIGYGEGGKCPFCAYENANPRALNMHRIAKHRR